MDLFQTSLYLLSSLLQADAAILGFGAIFIIYKIQSIEIIKQSIIQTYYTQGGVFTGIIFELLQGQPARIAEILNKQKNPDEFKNFKYIVCIPAKTKEIGESIRFPIIIIGSHAVLSGLFLYLSQFIFKCLFYQNFILIVSLLWFAFGIILASRLAINLLTKLDDYKLNKLRPDVFEFVTDKTDKKWSDN